MEAKKGEKVSADVLSKEFKVAVEIYKFNQSNEKVWYNRLVGSLDGKVSRATIAKSLNLLFDFGIVKAEYGETEPGHAGRLLYITNENKQTIKDLYEKFWKVR